MTNQCKAKSKRTGERCKRPCCIGKTVCYHHGGAAKSGVNPENPVQLTHGRYAKSLPADLAERYEYFKTDPKILELIPELAVARAMFERFINPLQEGQGISAAMGDEVRKWLDQIAKIAASHDKIVNGDRYTINVEGIVALMAQIADAISQAIGESGIATEQADKLRDIISRRLAAICGATVDKPGQ